MPYANIHWIKLKLELLNDKRFIFDCNNDQKWLYIGLLLLAGTTKNSTPSDENYLKNRLNLSETPQKVAENLQHILKTFPKLMHREGILKFKNFNTLHNKLGNYNGTPLDDQSGSKGNKEKIREDKRRIDKILLTFLDLKKYPKENEDLPFHYKRNTKTIKELLGGAKGDAESVIEAMKWFGGICDKKGYSWTLETILKWYPEYLVKGKTDSYDTLLNKFGLKGKNER